MIRFGRGCRCEKRGWVPVIRNVNCPESVVIANMSNAKRLNVKFGYSWETEALCILDQEAAAGGLAQPLLRHVDTLVVKDIDRYELTSVLPEGTLCYPP